MSLLDDLRNKLDADTFAAVTDQLGDEFNYDVVPRSRLNQVIKQRDSYKARVDAGTQPGSGSENDDDGGNPINVPAKNGGNGGTPVNIEALKAQYENEKNQAIEALRVEFAGLDELRSAGAHDPELVWGLLDRTKISRGADGKLTGIAEQIDALKEGKSFLFGATASQRQAGESGTGKNGGNSSPSGTITKDEFLKLSYNEQVNFKNAHPDQFRQFLEE